MDRLRIVIASAAFAVASGASVSATAFADDARAADSGNDRLVTDFRGRPPFERVIVSSAVNDAAGQELASKETRGDPDPDREHGADGRADRVQVADFGGAPPYRRRFVEPETLERAEFARFEETDRKALERSTRRGPPGKPASRR